MTRHGVLAHARLEPIHIQLITRLMFNELLKLTCLKHHHIAIEMLDYSIDTHARLEVVHTAQDHVHTVVSQTFRREHAHEMLEILHRRDVIVVRFDLHVRIYVPSAIYLTEILNYFIYSLDELACASLTGELIWLLRLCSSRLDAADRTVDSCWPTRLYRNRIKPT